VVVSGQVLAWRVGSAVVAGSSPASMASPRAVRVQRTRCPLPMVGDQACPSEHTEVVGDGGGRVAVLLCEGRSRAGVPGVPEDVEACSAEEFAQLLSGGEEWRGAPQRGGSAGGVHHQRALRPVDTEQDRLDVRGAGDEHEPVSGPVDGDVEARWVGDAFTVPPQVGAEGVEGGCDALTGSQLRPVGDVGVEHRGDRGPVLGERRVEEPADRRGNLRGHDLFSGIEQVLHRGRRAPPPSPVRRYASHGFGEPVVHRATVEEMVELARHLIGRGGGNGGNHPVAGLTRLTGLGSEKVWDTGVVSRHQSMQQVHRPHVEPRVRTAVPAPRMPQPRALPTAERGCRRPVRWRSATAPGPPRRSRCGSPRGDVPFSRAGERRPDRIAAGMLLRDPPCHDYSKCVE
jgi:hypothetical protein